MSFKPFLKWVGGKTQILDEVFRLFPTTINNYYEPFLGGGSVLFKLLDNISSGIITITGDIYVSDSNKTLIYCYKNIQNPESFNTLINEVIKLKTEYESLKEPLALNGTLVEKDKAGKTKKKTRKNIKPTTEAEGKADREHYYYWIRDKYNKLSDADKLGVVGSSIFIFLNKTCFRGVYRENSKSEFNVPYGNYKSPAIINRDDIAKLHSLLNQNNFKIHFNTSDFISIFEKIPSKQQKQQKQQKHQKQQNTTTFNKNDFIYLDPPYVPEKATSFVGYTNDGFNLENHKMLFDSCSKLKKCGIPFLLSNSNVNLVNNYFNNDSPEDKKDTKKENIKFNKVVIEAKRAIHSKKPDSKTKEVLIS